MNIDKSIIESMTSKEVLFSTQFLDDVFLKNKTNLNLDDETQLNTISTLIKASKKEKMKTILFSSLNIGIQEKLFDQLPLNDQIAVLLDTTPISSAVNLFKKLEPSLQNEFMIQCYKKNIELFKKLKKQMRPNISIHQGIIIEKTKINENMSSSYVSKLTQLISDSTISVTKTKEFAISLQNILSEKDLEQLTINFFSQFKTLNLKLDSKENFISYLKFFEVSVPLIVLYPSNINVLDTIIETFLLSLDSLSSHDWLIKLLNQVPIFILKKCCYEIQHFEKIKNTTKRNIYCRYNNLLLENINKPFAYNIKEAINQV